MNDAIRNNDALGRNAFHKRRSLGAWSSITYEMIIERVPTLGAVVCMELVHINQRINDNSIVRPKAAGSGILF